MGSLAGEVAVVTGAHRTAGGHARPVVEQEVVDRTPAGRWGTAEDVVRTVVPLYGPDAAFVTGQTLVVDGGDAAYGAAHAATRIPGVANA
jgi:NAD(P)-dependent dehydrogenase (short-subunit alcohol dehydrogenase family)